MVRTTLPLLASLAVLLASQSREARAVGAEERQLAVSAGVATVSVEERRPVGGVLALEGQYGLDDAWAAHVSMDASFHPEGGDAVRATGAGIGVTYALDVLRLVPFFELGARFVDVRGGVAARRGLGAQVGLGGEYLLTRRIAAAAILRYEYLPLRIGGLPPRLGGPPSRFALALRLGWTF